MRFTVSDKICCVRFAVSDEICCVRLDLLCQMRFAVSDLLCQICCVRFAVSADVCCLASCLAVVRRQPNLTCFKSCISGMSINFMLVSRLRFKSLTRQ